jgi:hypothetical protein
MHSEHQNPLKQTVRPNVTHYTHDSWLAAGDCDVCYCNASLRCVQTSHPFIKAVSQMMRASQPSGGWAGWAGCDECDECDECDWTGNERKQQGGLRTSMSCRFAPRRGKAATLPRALHVTVYPIP